MTGPTAETVTAAPPAPRGRFDLAQFPRITRARQVELAFEGASADPDFQEQIALADAARDCADWGPAEYHYARALARHPLHHGYRVQLGHALKEQGYFAQAEIEYRSAAALGAEPGTVDQHLRFVAQRNGSDFQREGRPDLDVSPLQAPPTRPDYERLAVLCWGGLATDAEADMLDALRTCASNAALMRRMVADPAFLPANQAFLELLQG